MSAVPDLSSSLLERIQILTDIGVALSRERDPIRLQERIMIGAKQLTNADGATIYTVSNEGEVLHFHIMQTDSLGIHMGGTSGAFIDMPPVPLHLPDGQPNLSSVVAYCVLKQCTVNIPDAYDAPGFDFAGTRAFDARTHYRSQSILTIPLRNHEDEIVGVLQLLNASSDGKTVIPFSQSAQRIAEGLASQASVAQSRQALINDMQALFEGFVQLIADAIDRKSPYTGGHCRRVTDLTMALAEATCDANDGPFAAFKMSEADRYELNIAALLHDCGKITTPEWVMDKARKLQTVFDRIDLVVARFDIMRRDLELDMMRGIAAGGDAGELQERYAYLVERLDEDLAFIKKVNVGTEAMSGEDQERVKRIAERTYRDAHGQQQPVLNADEIRNLCIVRGTLNDDERRVIQDHVVATINMLQSVPYPRHLKRVPEFAGGHHERVDGKGYPLRLTREQMSPQARMMAIADVFEALTAADRPYKDPMTLSKALTILGHMKEDGHVDPDLFQIFLKGEVWRHYAEANLNPEQIDSVDITTIPGYEA